MTTGQKTYEITFVVEPLDDDDADALLDELPDVFISSHGQVTTVDLQVNAVSGPVAARQAREILIKAGARPIRLDLGLVDRAAIAIRAGVTQQAVGLWVRGERGQQQPFPRPVVTVGATPAWSWAEVADWLVQRGQIEPGTKYLTLDQIQYANVWTCDGWRDAPSTVTPGVIGTGTDVASTVSWQAGGTRSTVASADIRKTALPGVR